MNNGEIRRHSLIEVLDKKYSAGCLYPMSYANAALIIRDDYTLVLVSGSDDNVGCRIPMDLESYLSYVEEGYDDSILSRSVYRLIESYASEYLGGRPIPDLSDVRGSANHG